MISVRRQYEAFGWGDFNWVDVGTKAVAAYTRTYDSQHLLILNNLSNSALTVTTPESPSGYKDLLTEQHIPSGVLQMQPLQFLWLIPVE
jgi:glycosidase